MKNFDIIEGNIKKEIHEWYNYFFEWTRGKSENEKGFNKLLESLDNDFIVVLTNGKIMNKDKYKKRLYNLKNSKRDDPKSNIKNIYINIINNKYILCNFELIKNNTKKINSCIFKINSYGNVKWFYVHESKHHQDEI